MYSFHAHRFRLVVSGPGQGSLWAWPWGLMGSRGWVAGQSHRTHHLRKPWTQSAG
jgi:hypothetical protein